MAGLVDYGVDSEDDTIRGNSPKSTNVKTPCDDYTNSDTEKSSSKTLKTKSEEVGFSDKKVPFFFFKSFFIDNSLLTATGQIYYQ